MKQFIASRCRDELMIDSMEFVALMKLGGVLDSAFTATEARLCFASSRMWVSGTCPWRRRLRISRVRVDLMCSPRRRARISPEQATDADGLC